MKKSIIKTSTFIGLSSLLVACGGGGGGAGNATADNVAQPINQQVQAQPQTQSQNPPKASEKTEIAPKAEAVPEGNKKNPAQPPAVVVVPPKAEKQPEARENVQSQGRNKRDVAEMNTPRTNVWTGRCESPNFCSVDQKNSVKTYTVNTKDNTLAGTSSYEKTTESETSIVLTLQKTSGDNYQFNLLSDNEQTATAYYGYRERASQSSVGRYYDFLYATNPDFTHTELPSKFSAIYAKDNGFFYSPLSVSSESDNKLRKQGNVLIVYKDGNVNGEIYDTKDKTDPIFKITGNGANLVVESTNNVPNPISAGEKAAITAQFVDSSKGKNDYKYILGAGKSEGGTGKTGWVGVLFAEKQGN